MVALITTLENCIYLDRTPDKGAKKHYFVNFINRANKAKMIDKIP